MCRLVGRLSFTALLTTIFVANAAAQGTAGSGKFAVGGDSAGTVGILRVNVDPSVDGPLTVMVKDSSSNVVSQGGNSFLTLALARNRNTATVSLTLAPGANEITVTDSNSPDDRVTVTWQPGVAYPVPSVAFRERGTGPVITVTKSAAEPKPDGKLRAEAKRIADRPNFAHVKVHVDPTLPNFDVVVKKTGTDEEIFRRRFDLPRGGGTEYSCQVKVDPEASTILVSAATTNETAEIEMPAIAAAAAAAPQAADEEELVEYDWGRVRGYFAMGMIFSKERDEFSKQDMFLDFTLDKTYLAKPFGPFKNFNTFFNARLTSIPVTATDVEGEEPEPDPTPENCFTPDCEAFVTSRKAAMMQAGIYLPMYWGFTMWDRNVPTGDEKFRKETNALFIAPLMKGGILTTTGQQTSEARQFGGDDVFNFYSFGAMIGHYRLHGKRDGKGFKPNTDVAPELISWLTLSYGRWENFEFETPSGLKDLAGNDILVRRRPYRIEALGRLKIPETPFIIGFDGNFGKGPDDVRFLFGGRFDIGKVLHTIKAAAAQDKMGKSN